MVTRCQLSSSTPNITSPIGIKPVQELAASPASEVVGTNLQWQTFYESARPTLADLIVNGSIEEQFDTYYHGLFKRFVLGCRCLRGRKLFSQAWREWSLAIFFTAAPLRDTDGNLVGAIETLQDVTNRKRAEEDLRHYQNQLEELVYQAYLTVGRCQCGAGGRAP
jgi:hypothetical protein